MIEFVIFNSVLFWRCGMCLDEYDVILIDYCYYVISYGVIVIICICVFYDFFIDDEVCCVSE